MNKLFSTLFLVFVIQITAHAQTNDSPLKLKELSYGYYTSHEVEKEQMDNSPTGTHNVIKDQTLVKRTDRIPAKSGTEFGAVYQLKGSGKDSVQLEIEWVYPHEIVDPKNNIAFKNVRYPINLPGNAINGSTYTLEEPFEIVTGEWQLNIYYINKLIYTKKFVLE